MEFLFVLMWAWIFFNTKKMAHTEEKVEKHWFNWKTWLKKFVAETFRITKKIKRINHLTMNLQKKKKKGKKL